MLHERESRSGSIQTAQVTASKNAAGLIPNQRLLSLDAFRGITIAGMILVNNPGTWSHVYSPLLHSPWHGWTPTDLVFPFFLFIVGISIQLSVSKHLKRGESKKDVTRKILSRSFVLMILGLALTAYEQFDFASMRLPFEHLRFPGVLQRIALVYLCASLLVLYFKPAVQAFAAGTCLVLYWALMTWAPVPGYGTGNLTPEGNLAAFIDRLLLPGHLGGVAGARWDGVGPFSTIPAVASGLLGALVGRWFSNPTDKTEVAGRLFVFGWAGILGGLTWNLWFPINKLLWSSSYVLFTTGAAMQLLGICYWIIEVKGWKGWAIPAVVLGMNSIAAFVLSTLLFLSISKLKIHTAAGVVSIRQWIYETIFLAWASPLNASLAFAVGYVLFWLGVMTVLYRLRIFIKI
jgi:predicted acyltransferase